MKKSQQSALRRLAATALVTIASAGTAVTAQAAYVVNATEVGADVVFEGSGSIDLTAMTFDSMGNVFAPVDPDGRLAVGPNASVDIYLFPTGLTGPSSIGPGTAQTSSTGGTGDYTQLQWAPVPLIAVPTGYTSNSPLTGTSTFGAQTFATLGLSPGVYDWTWGSGASADSFTLNVGAVPVPAAVWLFGSGLLGLIGVARRKKA